MSVDLSEVAEEIRRTARIDHFLTDLAGVRLKRTGASLMGCCPFHEDRNPSFSVMVDKGRYKCHAAGCGASGDIFSLVMATHAVTFPEAVRYLAQRLGIPLPGNDPKVAGRKVHEPARRATILYPPDEPGMVPAGLTDHGLEPLPAAARLPAPDEKVSAWSPEVNRVKSWTPETVHVYRDLAGNCLMLVLRCVKGQTKANGKREKVFIPLRPKSGIGQPACLIPGTDAELSWVVGGPDDGSRKPIYGIERILPAMDGRLPGLLIVEGEKTADAAQDLIRSAGLRKVALSPMGGGAAPLRADWSPLVSLLGQDPGALPVEITIWPDADALMTRPDGTVVDRQKKFVDAVAGGLCQDLLDAGLPLSSVIFTHVVPPADVPSGWDLADAVKDGWTDSDFAQHLKDNAMTTDVSRLPLRQTAASVQAAPPAGLVDATKPAGVAAEGADILGDIEALARNLSASARPADGLESRAPVALPIEGVLEGEVLPDLTPNDGGGRADDGAALEPIRDNPHFRALGYNGGADYFLNLESCQIYCLTAQALKPSSLLKLARRDWWERHFRRASRNENASSVDWERAIDALVSASYAAGFWDPSREQRLGACMDGGRVVYNTGSTLHVSGIGPVRIRDFHGDNCYTSYQSAGIPDFYNPFPADDPSVRKLLSILGRLNWRPENRELSILAIFGWICVSPISGIMIWRPHLWLTGPRSAGKSWILRSIVYRVLRDHAVYIKANSTEAGIRRSLHARSMPLVFDESEGETHEERNRLDSIIRMARHSASEDRSVVMQAGAAGAGSECYRIRSSFLFSSITPQLESAADKTRFAIVQLNEGHEYDTFTSALEDPAAELLTEEFSRRFMARIILRAPDFHATFAEMVKAMASFRVERRIVDVYASFATGAWLMLKDGVPEDKYEAITFIGQTFDMISQLQDHGDSVRDERDHERLFRVLQSSHQRVETVNSGARVISVGALIGAGCGFVDPSCPVQQDEALGILKNLGIRIGHRDPQASGEEFDLIAPGERGNVVVFHKNAVPISAMLKDTPYARDYSQVMLQSSHVRRGKVTKFSNTVGTGRTLIVPIAIFSLGDADAG